MDLRFAVDLTGGGEHETRAVRLRQSERVDGTDAIDLQRLDRIAQVVSRARRRCEVQDHVDSAFDVERLRDIPPKESEASVSFEVGEVARDSGEKVVNPDDLPAARQEVVAQMRAEKSGGSGDRHGRGRRAHAACR